MEILELILVDIQNISASDGIGIHTCLRSMVLGVQVPPRAPLKGDNYMSLTFVLYLVSILVVFSFVFSAISNIIFWTQDYWRKKNKDNKAHEDFYKKLP